MLPHDIVGWVCGNIEVFWKVDREVDNTKKT